MKMRHVCGWCAVLLACSAMGLPEQALAAMQQPGTKPVVTATPKPAPPETPAETPATVYVPFGGGAAIGPTTPAPAPASEPGPLPEIASTYKIGPSDALQVTVWKEPNLSGSLTVRPDGMISLPLVGDVAASGLTPMRLGADLTTRLKKYINDPLVTVTVVGVNSKRIYLLGEVQHIGPLPLVQGMTPLQAISAAGGPTPYANLKHIYILRGEQGRQQKLPYNYKKALKDGNQQGITLAAGDTIVVP